MAKFIVLHTPILHDGKRYEVGAEIELTAEQAENLAIHLQAVEDTEKSANETDVSNVTEEDVAKAEAQIADAEKAKGKKK